MKSLKQLIVTSSVLILTLVLFALNGCGGDPEPQETEAQKATRILTTGSWVIQSVSVDGQDRSATYKDLRLTFATTSVSSTNGGAIWPSSTTWRFKDDAGKTIERGDGLAISITELSSTRLVLALTWSKTTLGGGRDASIAGQHSFAFTK